MAEPERRSAAWTSCRRRSATRILREWNDTARAVPRATLPELFAAQVARTPGCDGGGVRASSSLSYRELDARANQLAHHLRALGVGPEVVVGLCVERSLEMLVGAARHPQGRRRLSAARPRLPAGAARLHARGCARPGAGHAVGAARAAARHRRPRRAASMPTADASPRSPPPPRTPRSTRTTPPTSSTPQAQPEHQKASRSRISGVVQSIVARCRPIFVDAARAIACSASRRSAFDASIEQRFCCRCCTAHALVLMADDEHSEPARFWQHSIAAACGDCISTASPSMLAAVIEAAPRSRAAASASFCGGEALRRAAVRIELRSDLDDVPIDQSAMARPKLHRRHRASV